MQKNKVALVGVSGYGKTHLTNLLDLAEAGLIDFAAAVVINPEEVPDTLKMLHSRGCRIYGSLDEMFAAEGDSFDLVALPVGIPAHLPLSRLCLGHQANVLLEKPAAGCVADVDKIQEAELQSGGKFVAIGYQHIYHTEIQQLKRRFNSGAIGRIHRITIAGIWPRNDRYYHRNNWAGKRYSASGTPIFDSPINNAFAHYLNLGLFLAGGSFDSSAKAEAVSGELYRARPELETFDTCAVRFTTDNQVEIRCLLSHTATSNLEPIIKIEGDSGQASWQIGGDWSIGGTTPESGRVIPQHGRMFRDVVARISDPTRFVCTLNIARAHTQAIELMSRELAPRQLAQDEISRIAPDGQYVLRDVKAVWEKCFAASRLPSELGLQWQTV